MPVMVTPAPITAGSPTTRKHRRWLVPFLVAGLVLTVVFAWWYLTQQGDDRIPVAAVVSLDPAGIAVVPFANQTGDGSLDSLGRRAADRIIRELAAVDEFQVAPINVVAGTARGRPPLGPEARALVHDVATATSSGLVLVGVIYAPGNEIEIQASLENAASGRTIRSFDTLRGPREEVDTSIDTLAGWVFITAMEELHPSLRFGAGDHIPDLNAFREFLTGLPTAGIDSAVWDHFWKALELDPEFDRIRLRVVFGLWKLGAWQWADQIIRPLEESRSRLTPSQQRLVDAGRWGLDGRWGGSLGLLQEYSAANPDDCVARFAVIMCARPPTNLGSRSRSLRTIGGTRFSLRTSSSSLLSRCTAHHQLGQYEQELSFCARSGISTGASTPRPGTGMQRLGHWWLSVVSKNVRR